MSTVLWSIGGLAFFAGLAWFARVSGDRAASVEDRDDDEPWTELLVRRHRKEKL